MSSSSRPLEPSAQHPIYDATNSVRLCDQCEDEMGTSAGADARDRACSGCGAHDAPFVYPRLHTDDQELQLLGQAVFELTQSGKLHTPAQVESFVQGWLMEHRSIEI